MKFAEGEGYDSPEGASDMCNHASDEFIRELTEYNIKGQIEYYETHIKIDVQDYPYNLHKCCFHWAVRVGEWVIDWTARQFDEDAPFPAVWKGERREWRNVKE